EAGPDRLGPAALPLWGLGRRRAGEAEVRPVLCQEPWPGVRLHDPAADGGSRAVQARSALKRPSAVPSTATICSNPHGATRPRLAARAHSVPRPDIRMASTQDIVHDFIVTTFPGDGTDPASDMDLLEA